MLPILTEIGMILKQKKTKQIPVFSYSTIHNNTVQWYNDISYESACFVCVHVLCIYLCLSTHVPTQVQQSKEDMSGIVLYHSLS